MSNFTRHTAAHRVQHAPPFPLGGPLENICEMYFGRFYEFKERLKKYFDAVKAVSPDHGLDIGKFIRQYERLFDSELRARHGVHHHGRFEDLAISRVYLMSITFTGRTPIEIMANRLRYRGLTKEWVGRVRRRGEEVDAALEAVADATLRTCRFLVLYLLAATIAECRGVEEPFAPKPRRGSLLSGRRSTNRHTKGASRTRS